MANKMAGLARKWGMPATFSSAGLTSSMREERKGPNFDHLNVVSLTLHGQQTVQEVVSKATALFRYLHGVSLIADEKIRIEEQNNKKRIQETLNSLKELFSRLRALYDGSNRRIDEPSDQDLEVGVLLTLCIHIDLYASVITFFLFINILCARVCI